MNNMRRTNKPKKVLDKKLKQKYVTKIETGLYLITGERNGS